MAHLLPSNPWRGYLCWLFGVMCAVLASVGTFNVLMDPLDAFGLWKFKGINAVKPYVNHHKELAKIRRAGRQCADTGIFGNSRAEVGLDPEAEIFAERGLKAFNYAVAASDARVALRLMLWLDAAGCYPRNVIWGAEFFDFLGGASAKPLPTLVSDPMPGIDASLWASQVFSTTGLRESVSTLALQYKRYPAEMTEFGFTPLNHYEREVEQVGHYSLFRQRAEDNFQRWRGKPARVAPANGDAAEQQALLDAALAQAVRQGGTTYIVIYPYHAQIRLMMEQLNLSGLFGDWKRQLVAAAERHGKQGRIEVWDFSVLSPQTLEAIPAKGDRRTRLAYYWEAGHFKKALGDLVLERLLGKDNGFGVRLHAGNIDAVLQRDGTEALRALMAADPPLWAEVRSLSEQ